MADQDDSIKRKHLLHQAAIVALGSLAAGAAVELPIEGDADSMIHLQIVSGSKLGTEKQPVPSKNAPDSPQKIGIIVIEATKPKAGGYDALKGFANQIYYEVDSPFLHGKGASDSSDTATPFSSPSPVYIAIGWNT